MKLDVNSEVPIFQQVAEIISNEILNKHINEGEQVPSTNEIADFYQINPATARKGLNLLVEDEILIKKRGIGMFVKEGASQKILMQRKNEFYQGFLKPLLEEANRLGISLEEVKQLIDKQGE
ncbi:GntR family transcriptional regulator [Rummeliibacillus sp. NPDC094406]|uniref:GntR family transcriptional regulator n=1 Tax=Rummeliibacillus sp. NPDC094406 TaxID=3364511 RepID=UPI00381E8367